MKKLNYLSMWLCILMTCISVTSCSSDDDEPIPDSIVGRWTYTDKFQEGDETVTANYSLTFTEVTATYQVVYTFTKGSQTQTVSDFANYTYTYSDDFVVLQPQTANYAYLEGKIISNVKMEVTNVSSGEIIGVFYRQ